SRWNDGYRVDFGPSRSTRCTCAFRPTEPFAVATRNVRFTSTPDECALPVCVNTGHSLSASWKGQVDPKPTIKIGLMNELEAHESGLWLKSCRRLKVGGSTLPGSMIRALPLKA